MAYSDHYSFQSVFVSSLTVWSGRFMVKLLNCLVLQQKMSLAHEKQPANKYLRLF